MPGFGVQTGDVVHYDGTGERTLYGETFDGEQEIRESVWGKGPGQLLSANSAPTRVGSQFFITTGEQVDYAHLYGSCVCFGRVVEGLEVLQRLEKVYALDHKQRPRDYDIFIQDCNVST